MNVASKQLGVGVIKIIVLIPVVFIVLVIAIFGFYEARKAYWDRKVTQMCEADGGFEVFEKIILSKNEYEKLGGSGGYIPTPVPRHASNEQVYVQLEKVDYIRKRNPAVIRSEKFIKRQTDGKILGRSIYYSRRQGDFPSIIGHSSSFGCPEGIFQRLKRQVFVIERN